MAQDIGESYIRENTKKTRSLSLDDVTSIFNADKDHDLQMIFELWPFFSLSGCCIP